MNKCKGVMDDHQHQHAKYLFKNNFVFFVAILRLISVPKCEVIYEQVQSGLTFFEMRRAVRGAYPEVHY
jgi:UDP-N-acetylglucosamine transferase subunit ALG13